MRFLCFNEMDNGTNNIYFYYNKHVECRREMPWGEFWNVLVELVDNSNNNNKLR